MVGWAGEGGRGARYAAAVCVMYWLLLSCPLTLAVASVATLLVTLLIYLKTLLRRRDSLARLTCRDSALCQYVTRHCHAFRRALQLPLWSRNRHVQSLLALWAQEPGVQFERQYLQLWDKGLVALDWELGGQHLPHGRPVLLVLPDLPQSALQLGALCHEAFTFGLKAVVVNRRGQGDSPLNTPKMPAYGDADDLREVVDFLRQEGGITLSAVGIGTGADLLLSYLGQYGSSAHLTSAVCVSPSFSGEKTLHGLRFPYSLMYLAHLKHAVLRHAPVFGQAAEQARHAWSVKDFDSRLHCGQGRGGRGGGGEDGGGGEKIPKGRGEVEEGEENGGGGGGGGDCEGGDEGPAAYASLEEFWADNEPLREADEISVPVLCLCSLDDPISCLPSPAQHELFRALPNLFLLTLPRGGHAGFRYSLQGLSWADHAAMDFVLSMLNYHPHHAHPHPHHHHPHHHPHHHHPHHHHHHHHYHYARHQDDVSSSCGHSQTGVEESFFDFQCRAEDEDVLDSESRSCGAEDEEDLLGGEGHREEVLEEEESHAMSDDVWCRTKDGCPNGHCSRNVEEQHADPDSVDREMIEIDRLTRTPTEGHGLR